MADRRSRGKVVSPRARSRSMTNVAVQRAQFDLANLYRLASNRENAKIEIIGTRAADGTPQPHALMVKLKRAVLF